MCGICGELRFDGTAPDLEALGRIRGCEKWNMVLSKLWLQVLVDGVARGAHHV